MKPKFRVWDKQDKEIYLVEEINFNCGEFESIGDGITFLRGAEKLELLLSTNTKDKTGKEIFEGMFFRLITLKLLYALGNTSIMITLVRAF